MLDIELDDEYIIRLHDTEDGKIEEDADVHDDDDVEGIHELLLPLLLLLLLLLSLLLLVAVVADLVMRELLALGKLNIPLRLVQLVPPLSCLSKLREKEKRETGREKSKR